MRTATAPAVVDLPGAAGGVPPRKRIVVYNDDPQQLQMRRHVIRVAQRDSAAVIGDWATCEIVACDNRPALLEFVEGAERSLAFIDLESRVGDMRGARLIRTLNDDAQLRRVTCVAMTAHNSFDVLVALGRDVVAVLGTTGENLEADAAQALQHACIDGDLGRRAFPRSHTPGNVQAVASQRFLEHFGFEPRPGDLLIVSNLAHGVADSVTNRELEAIVGGRSAVAHFKRAVKDARGVPVDLIVPLTRSYQAGVLRQSLEQPVRAGTLDLAATVVGDARALRLSRLTPDDVALVRSVVSRWDAALSELDARDQAGRQMQVLPTLVAACPDEAERARLVFAVHVLADVAAEPVPLTVNGAGAGTGAAWTQLGPDFLLPRFRGG